MRAVIQRVSSAQVEVDGECIARIGAGLCVLVGAMGGDTTADAEFISRKLVTLRIYHDEAGRMNRSVHDTGGSIVLISQFTLAADTTSGTRPSFSSALPPEQAEPLLDKLAGLLRTSGVSVETGRFGARMEVALVNSGPVTICLDSRAKVRK